MERRSDDIAVYSPSQLNQEVRGMLETVLPSIWVEGEISNLARPSSGHLYFTLKDASAQVRCALFRGRASALRHRPADGDQIRVRAKASLYPARGEFQLVIEHLEPAGEGALQRAFEALKQRLGAEGLFDAASKRPLPCLPRRLGVITSPTGAAIRDVLQVLQRRFPALPVLVYPVPVQGDAAAPAIVRALELAGRRCEVDTLLLTRGGGSLEDLWPFNEESVARAIRACPIPVVSAVGHEVDVTIADLAADLRAPTPSAAAETLSPDRHAWQERLERIGHRLETAARRRLGRDAEQLAALQRRLAAQHPGRRLRDRAQRLDELESRLHRLGRQALEMRGARLETARQRLQVQDPRRRTAHERRRIEELAQRLRQSVRGRLEASQQRLGTASRALHAVSPLATLERGYAVVQRVQDGAILRQAEAVEVGERIRARLAHGALDCRVEARRTTEDPLPDAD
ncbi:exodeoxyribonuclease VII large subunit [Halorhodospira halophila]|uniref:exodeoxyribonuclease VII large subunit n=1 Tax=Halorhodospira halophila TaxID=1053 RepID=UPI001911ACE4|nr:exodeoxyribonuclease VII large subunit [Halorhodospira halophila]MBK5943998.1 exodeoxyribonuclease VII large subunit [Halorhodospira halophila]